MSLLSLPSASLPGAKVTAMLNDVMNRKVHQAEICLLIGAHKVSAQMIDGRETIVVIGLREVLGKDRVAFDGSRLVEPHEKARINFVHCGLKQFCSRSSANDAAHSDDADRDGHEPQKPAVRHRTDDCPR